MKYFVKEVKSNSDQKEYSVHIRKGGKLLHYKNTVSSCKKYVEQESLKMNIRHYNDLKDKTYKKLTELFGENNPYNGYIGVDENGAPNESRTHQDDLLC